MGENSAMNNIIPPILRNQIRLAKQANCTISSWLHLLKRPSTQTGKSAFLKFHIAHTPHIHGQWTLP
jgi:hypothetical protein